MCKGLVFGKFLPFHKGHAALIEFGAAHCAELIVLVCESDKEDLDGEIRCKWIRDTYPKRPNIRVELFKYNEDEYPNSSVSSEAISEIWARVFLELHPDFKVVFTSEAYGEFLARFMNIEHISFDPPRQRHQISASIIRQSPFKYWEHIPDAVRPWFTKKVVLLGTESTGKSTLTKKLAAHFHTAFVPEAARDIIEISTDVVWEHLPEIAEAHARLILDTLPRANKILFIDTDLCITQSYARFLFDRDLQVPKWVEVANHAHLYLYSAADAPYVQDGNRLPETRRNALDAAHRAYFDEIGLNYSILTGSWEKRFRDAIDLVKQCEQAQFKS